MPPKVSSHYIVPPVKAKPSYVRSRSGKHYEFDNNDGETMKFKTARANKWESDKRNSDYIKVETKLKNIISGRKTTFQEKEQAYKRMIKNTEERYTDIQKHFERINKEIRLEIDRRPRQPSFFAHLSGLCESRGPLFFELLHTRYKLTKNLIEESKFRNPTKDVSKYTSTLKHIENIWNHKDTSGIIKQKMDTPNEVNIDTLYQEIEKFYGSGSVVKKDNWQPITTFQERTIKKFGKYGALALKVCDVYMWGGVAVRFNSLVAGTLIAGPSGCYQIYSPNPVLSAPTIVKSDEGQCNCSLSPSCNTAEGIVDGLNYYWQGLPALDITTLKNGEQIYTFNGTKQPAGAISRPMTAKEAINLLPLVLSLLKKVNKKVTNYIKIIIVCIIISVFIFCVYKIYKINNFLPRPLRNL